MLVANLLTIKFGEILRSVLRGNIDLNIHGGIYIKSIKKKYI